MSFAAAANDLRHREIARLKQYVTPPVETMRSLTPGPFRERIAELAQRLGHEVVNDPAAAVLITVKNGEKHLIMCATPSDPAPTGTRDVARLHDAVIGAGACRGLYVTTRAFTADARDYAKSAPIDLVDGAVLAKALERARTGGPLPAAYEAMCHECGAIIRHDLDKRDPLPCINGHMVAPTIARAAIDPVRYPPEPDATQSKPWRDMSPKSQRRRAIKAHNHRVRGRAIRQQRDGD